VATALAAGFRESGVVAAARRVIVTLRCSIRLEARRKAA
jgi:tRNA(Phe) wybutosine-synthesizing methylase Tyw3